ncbi:MAG: PQQ-dependent sugar dehydrogenase [Verrucomicrobiae bacterium]|nr:PQQ-dependent sugar dehydrogenase [Verrucomicrobiae bacterium]
MRGESVFYCLGVAAVMVASLPGTLPAQQPPGGLDAPAAIGPFLNDALPPRTPRTGTGDWALEPAFPNLSFVDPMQMVAVPRSSLLMVIQRDGQFSFFENDPSTATQMQVLDLSAHVQNVGDSGMLGLAFHPDFGDPASPNRDYLYVYYRWRPSNPGDIDRAYCRLSRFTWSSGSAAIDPASEFVLINQYDRHNWHNGGGMFFGEDGLLYLSVGDEGGADDQFNSAQRRDRGLFAGVLRIDVDRDLSRGHPIRRQPVDQQAPPAGWPASSTQGYTIPDDNPWQSPDGSLLEEFYALGLRSPHRMTFDPFSESILVGDVGQGAREEVSFVEKGANLQWPYREGNVPGQKTKPSPPTGYDLPPILDYDRSIGSCVIGGHVYRGTAQPELAGRYVYGDYVSGRVWAMTLPSGGNPASVEELIQLEQHVLHSFAVDADNELYVLRIAGTGPAGIFKLARTGLPVPEPPALLSRTGAFANLATLGPAPGVLPYDVIQPLWSDGADKKRWIAIPNDGNPDSAAERIDYSATGEWAFPVGTVLIKHFELLGKRLETRFMARGDDGEWYGMTYRWNEAGTDADLLPGPAVEETIDFGAGGTYTWHYPSRTECFLCHTPAAGRVLGLKTRTLNRDLLYPVTGRTANQIVTLNRLGFLNPAVDEPSLSSVLTSKAVADTGASPGARARSYLDINCSQCHRPGGTDRANFDARLSTPLSLQGLVDVDPRASLGIDGEKIVKTGDPSKSILAIRLGMVGGCCPMPPLAKNRVDQAALAVVEDWIVGLATNHEPTLEPLNDRLSLYGIAESFTLAATDPDDDGVAFVVTGLPGGMSYDAASGVISGRPLEAGVFAVQVVASDGRGGTDSGAFAWTVSAVTRQIEGLEYDYFEGEWSAVPDFDALTPVRSGVATGFGMGSRLRDDAFAFRFRGNIEIPAGGGYTFYLNSDDGSRLWIDGALVVENDGLHAEVESSGQVTLSAGLHSIEVGFFEFYGEEILDVSVSGPGLAKRALPAAWLFHRETFGLPPLMPLYDGHGAAPPPGAWDTYFAPENAGRFSGLFYDADDGETIRGGLLALRLARNGRFSAVLSIDGRRRGLRGSFDENGAFATDFRGGGGLTLQLRATANGVKLGGAIVWNGATATLDAASAPWTGRHPAPWRGAHSLAIPAMGAPSPDTPGGHGFGAGVIGANGSVRLLAVLGDGKRTALGGQVSADGEWFLYREPYRRKEPGLFAGRVVFREVPSVSDFDGLIQWRKPSISRDRLYPGGFDLTREMIGSRLLSPRDGGPPRWLENLAESAPNAVLSLTPPGSGAEESQIEWDAIGRLAFPESGPLKARVNPRNGRLGGWFREASGDRLRLGGVVFQKQSLLIGHFPKGAATGPLTVAPIE